MNKRLEERRGVCPPGLRYHNFRFHSSSYAKLFKPFGLEGWNILFSHAYDKERRGV